MLQELTHTQFSIKNLDSLIELLKMGKNYKEAIKYGTNDYNVSQYKINKLKVQQMGQLVNLIEVNYMNLQKEGETKDERKKTTWQANELKLFVWISICHSYLLNKPLQDYEQEDWTFFTNILTRKTTDDLDFQSKSLFKNYKGNKEKWDQQEENLLKTILEDQQYQNKWNDVSRMLYFKSGKKYYRSSQKCREYWFNHLDARLNKNPWTVDEDIKLVNQLLVYGFKWSKLTQVIENNWGYRRTEHMVKNRTKYLCKKYGYKDQKEQGCMKELKLIDKKLKQQKTKLEQDENSVKQEQNVELSHYQVNIELNENTQSKKDISKTMEVEMPMIKEEEQRRPLVQGSLQNVRSLQSNTIQVMHKQTLQSQSQSQEDYSPPKKPTYIFTKPQIEQKSTIKRNVIILYHASQSNLQQEHMQSENQQSPQIIIGRHVEEQQEEEQNNVKEESYYDEYNIVEEVPNQQIDLNEDIQFQHDTHGGKMRQRVTHQLAKFFPGPEGQC